MGWWFSKWGDVVVWLSLLLLLQMMRRSEPTKTRKTASREPRATSHFFAGLTAVTIDVPCYICEACKASASDGSKVKVGVLQDSETTISNKNYGGGSTKLIAWHKKPMHVRAARASQRK